MCGCVFKLHTSLYQLPLGHTVNESLEGVCLEVGERTKEEREGGENQRQQRRKR